MEQHKKFFQIAAQTALRSLCLRDKCGAIIIGKDHSIIASGYNAPPLDDIQNRKCTDEFPIYDRKKPKTDCTCCVHAEWRAIMSALRHGKDLRGSTMYFTRVNIDGQIEYSGEPYCTACSRLAYDNHIATWVLWHEEGIKLYDAKVMYDLTYEFQKQRKNFS